LQQFESTISFEQVQSFANRHCWGKFNKQMDMVNSNVKLVNFTSIFNGNFSDEPFTINLDSIKLERVQSVFRFPYKMEGVLPEGMFKGLQIHFFTPDSAENFIAHAKSFYLIQEGIDYPLNTNNYQELNLVEEGNSSLGLKAEVSLPLM
jgi:hypothetical protein